MLGVPESVSGTQPGGGPVGGRTMGGDRGVVGGFFLRVTEEVMTAVKSCKITVLCDYCKMDLIHRF